MQFKGDDEVYKEESEDPFEDMDTAAPIDDEQYKMEQVGCHLATYEMVFGSIDDEEDF